MLDILNQDIQYLPGVGPKKRDMLQKELGISKISDLLEYYPYKYVDRSRIYTINELRSDGFSVSRSLAADRARSASWPTSPTERG